MRRLAVAIAAVALLAGCGEREESTKPGGTERLTLMLDFFPNADHAPVYAAQAGGHFKNVGLDVQIRAPSDPAAPLRQVAAGRADVAISYTPEVMRARDKGAEVVSVGALVQVPLTSIISLPDAKITEPEDLRGKEVGTAGIDYQSAFLQTIVEDAGVDVGERAGRAAVAAGHRDGAQAARAGGAQALDHVGGSAAGRDPERQIARGCRALRSAARTPGRRRSRWRRAVSTLVSVVSAIAATGAALALEAADQIDRQMLRVGGAAAVAEHQHLAARRATPRGSPPRRRRPAGDSRRAAARGPRCTRSTTALTAATGSDSVGISRAARVRAPPRDSRRTLPASPAAARRSSPAS